MSLEDTLKNLKFDDGLGNYEELTYISYNILNNQRKDIYINSNCFNSYNINNNNNNNNENNENENENNNQIYSVKYYKNENIIEHIIIYNGNEAIPVYCECGISYEPFSPSGMVEYQYDPDGPWRLAKISREPLEAYKASKFTLWRGMLDKPSCEAAFARMLQSGPINRIYDKLGFPIPEEEQAKWRITDENTGKLVDIPRPVHRLRIWNPSTDSYDEISALLGGAPNDDELENYWIRTLEEMKVLHGEEYIQNLLNRGR